MKKWGDEYYNAGRGTGKEGRKAWKRESESETAKRQVDGQTYNDHRRGFDEGPLGRERGAVAGYAKRAFATKPHIFVLGRLSRWNRLGRASQPVSE